MKVNVKLHAALAVDGAGNILDVPDASPVGEVLAGLGIADPGQVVVLVDGKAASPETPLVPGCTLEVVPVVEGG